MKANRVLSGAAIALAATACTGKLLPVPPPPRIQATIDVGANVREVEAGEEAMWINAFEVIRVDPSTNRVVARIRPSNDARFDGVHDLATAPGAVWASYALAEERVETSGNTTSVRTVEVLRSVARIDPTTNRVVADVPIDTFLDRAAATGIDMTVSGTDVWVSVGYQDTVGRNRGALIRIDSRTNRATLVRSFDEQVRDATPIGDSVWLAARDAVVRVARDGRVAERVAVLGAVGIIPADDSLFVRVLSGERFGLVRLDPSDGGILGRIAGVGSGGMTFAAGSLWVADGPDGFGVKRIDTRRNQVTRALSTFTPDRDARQNPALGAVPFDVALGFGSVWVAHKEAGTVVRFSP